MQSTEMRPHFRKLSDHMPLSSNGTPRYTSSSLLFSEKDQEEHRDPEKECFMCRQANVYIKPIGMQQERRVARRHPPTLTRAQIDELSQKKHLTKREVRELLQCYFPEIKNIKYFQLHKYHSCCYDPKHLNLCKNHITAFQHERDEHPHHHSDKHRYDEEHYKGYERDDGHQNRVSFVRIKIEPTKGIPTRFLGPAALPESLADMLIKQVNRVENKKKQPSFGLPPKNPPQMYNVRRIEQPYGQDVSRLSEHLANMRSDDDDDDDDDNDSDNDSDEDEDDDPISSRHSRIRGYQGKVMDKSRVNYEKRIQTKQEKPKLHSVVSNGDLVVEDLDELNDLYTNGPEVSTVDHPQTSNEPLKKKKRKKRTKKKHTHKHHIPKLNHWEIMALDQSKQESCGCRHHVRRLEADQVVYDWCRCKDHQHKDIRIRRKSIPPPPTPPPPPPPPRKKKKTPPPKVEKKTIGINATEPQTNEIALAYDASTIDYDVIQEVLYYRTSSGRLVKPAISNAFSYDNMSGPTGFNLQQTSSKKNEVVYMTTLEHLNPSDVGDEKRRETKRLSLTGSLTPSIPRSISNHQSLIVNEVDELESGYKPPPSSASKTGQLYPDDDDDDDDEEEEEDDDAYKAAQFSPTKYIPERASTTPIQSPTMPVSMQKSSKPTYINQRPTPNLERESSIVANRRWFDQALGDQNLLAVHDGRYGLIAGSTTDQYVVTSQLPDNDYTEQYTHRNKSNCTIS